MYVKTLLQKRMLHANELMTTAGQTNTRLSTSSGSVARRARTAPVPPARASRDIRIVLCFDDCIESGVAATLAYACDPAGRTLCVASRGGE